MAQEGFFAEKVLVPLGSNIQGSQYLEPDGNFPNHIPNPDNKEAMKSIQEAVLKNKADIGVIFDTDVDRSALVDSKGEPLNRNNLIGVISAILIKENPGTTIVTSSATSEHLKNLYHISRRQAGPLHYRLSKCDQPCDPIE